MQLKKAYFALVAVMMMLFFTAGAYAQPGVNISLSFLGAAGVAETANTRTAETSDYNTTGSAIRVSASVSVPASPVTGTRLTLSFGVPITSAPLPGAITGVPPFGGSSAAPGLGNNLPGLILGLNATAAVLPPAGGVPTTDPIRIFGNSGIFSTGSSQVSIYTINYAAGTITVFLPQIDYNFAGQTTSGSSISASTTNGTFLIEGIRLDVSQQTAGTISMTAALSGLANNYNLSTTTLQVINSLTTGIASVKQESQASGGTNTGTATIFTNGVVGDPSATVTIREGYASAWRVAADYKRFSAADVPNPDRIRLTFTGIPTGVTLTLTLGGTGEKSSTINGSFSPTTVTAALPTTTFSFTADSLTATEAFSFFLVPNVTSTTGVAAGSISVTATMAPVGAALDANNLPTESDGFPKFAAVEVGTGGVGTAGPVIVNIIAASTTMLVPFIYVGPGGFDTGIEVANTTADPFGAAGGGAVPAAGSLTVTFYPTAATGGAGTAVVYGPTSSTAKVGFGLSSDGTLASGAVYTVNASQLLPAGTTQFVGYAFIQANFLNAHGTATISDYRTYSLTSHVLVLPPPLSLSRAQTLEGGLNNSLAPGLGF